MATFALNREQQSAVQLRVCYNKVELSSIGFHVVVSLVSLAISYPQ